MVWNASASLPIGLYRVQAGPVRRGDVVLVRLSPDIAQLARQRHYLVGAVYVIKVVAAIGGDDVCRLADLVLVRGVLAARALRRDSLGRSMPSWTGCRRLAAGEFLVLAPDTHSFDSRYFGVVSATQVVGRAVPFWLTYARR